MLSSNAGARLFDGDPHDISAQADALPTDADTVRLTEVDLLAGSEPEFRYWIVIWSEQGVEKPIRRFWTHRDAKLFAARLKCRLNIDAYNRECELVAVGNGEAS
jgi:hypothetical protein